MHVLLLGVTDAIHEHARQLSGELPDIRFHAGTSVDDVEATYARVFVSHAFIGGGFRAADRLALAERIIELSGDATPVHIKDAGSGQENFLPFVRAVLSGLSR